MTIKPFPEIIQPSQLQSIEDCKEILLSWLCGDIENTIRKDDEDGLFHNRFVFYTDKGERLYFRMFVGKGMNSTPTDNSKVKGFYSTIEVSVKSFNFSDESNDYMEESDERFGNEIVQYNFLPIDLLAKEIHLAVKTI